MSHVEGLDDTGGQMALPDAFAVLARWNYGLTAFYLRRWQRQLELPLRVAHTTSPSELIELRRAFEADLIADYADQAAALHDACGQARSAHGSAYAAELLKAQDQARQLLDHAREQADRIIASAEARANEILAAATTLPLRSAG